MGGWGSGRQGGQPVADHSLRNDIGWMLRNGSAVPGSLVCGSLTWNRGGDPAGSIRYTADLATGNRRRADPVPPVHDLDNPRSRSAAQVPAIVLHLWLASYAAHEAEITGRLLRNETPTAVDLAAPAFRCSQITLEQHPVGLTGAFISALDAHVGD